MEKIMIVDDNMSNLVMAKKTLEEFYEVIPVSSGVSALECLKDMTELPDLVILDIDMPVINGFQVISEMKNSKKFREIPIIFLTAQDDAATELEGYNLGGSDYITKPYTAGMLKKRVDIQIKLITQTRKLREYTENLSDTVQEKIMKIAELGFSVVDMFVDMLEKRNAFWGQHSSHVAKDMEIFLDALKKNGTVPFSSDECLTLSFASKIHDIGKLCINDKYLEAVEGSESVKVGFEYDAVKTHSSLGAETLSKITQLKSSDSSFFQYALNMCHSHHEKWDGSGYPEGLKGEAIPLEARILAIVNYYDNVRYSAVEGKKLNHQDALLKIQEKMYTSFDPSLVEVFFKCEREISKANP